jgi:hypothetical protein
MRRIKTREVREWLLLWVLLDEDHADFAEFCATNAASIALLDELTLRRDFRPCFVCKNPVDLASLMLPPKAHVWVDFYRDRIERNRIKHASGDDSEARILEDARSAAVIHPTNRRLMRTRFSCWQWSMKR